MLMGPRPATGHRLRRLLETVMEPEPAALQVSPSALLLGFGGPWSWQDFQGCCPSVRQDPGRQVDGK